MDNKEMVLMEMFESREIFGTSNEYPGYRNICKSLVETGECLTTVFASPIFKKGGIHNFVKETPYEQGVDLIKLTLDRESVYQSMIFKDHVEKLIARKKLKLAELLQEADKIQEFIKEFE